jgi:hypothetical protein
MFKERKRANSVALNAYLTYVTLPWYRIIAGIVFYLTYVTEPWYQSKIIGKPYILKVFEMG